MGGRNLKDYPRCPRCGFKKWVSRIHVGSYSEWVCDRCDRLHFEVDSVGVSHELAYDEKRGRMRKVEA